MPSKPQNNQSGTGIEDFVVDSWGGLNTAIKSAKDLPIGVSPDSMNWITGWDPNQKKGDHIELRRGMALLGTRNTAHGSVNGLGIGRLPNGNQVPFFSFANNLQYYDASTLATVGFYTMPAAAENDDISIESFQSLAGSFVYISSLNSSLYKTSAINLGGIIDIGNELGTPIRGNINFTNLRMNLWNKNGQGQGTVDQTDLFQSAQDFGNYSDMGMWGPPTTGEASESVGIGDGSTKTFSHTLANQQGGSVAQVLIAGATSQNPAIVSGISVAVQAVITAPGHGLIKGQYFIVTGIAGTMNEYNGSVVTVVSADANHITTNLNTIGLTYSSGGTLFGVEYFTDNQEGILNSNLGGTGTMNYMTGNLVINFNTAPIMSGVIAANYFFQAAGSGVEHFLIPGSPGATDAYLWPQRDSGGTLNSVQPFQGSLYCFHTYRTWVETTDNATYSNSTDVPFRNNIGTPFYKSAYPTGDGVIFLDNSNSAFPRFQVLSIAPNSTTDTVEPERLSDNLDLTQYAFDAPPVIYWENFYIFGCQNLVNGFKQPFNGTMFSMNTLSGYWDKLDYQASLLDEYYGSLTAGSSVSPNLFTLFSGFDDDGAIIANFWTSGIYNLGFDGLKATQRFVLEGLIQPPQSVQVYVSYDQGPFTLVQTIQGNDSCVSKGSPQLVGGNTLGSNTIGAGAVYANPFLLDFNLASPLYNYIQVKFVATGIGYIELDRWTLKINNAKAMSVQPANTIN